MKSNKKPNPSPRFNPSEDDDLPEAGCGTYVLGTFLLLANLYIIYIMARELLR